MLTIADITIVHDFLPLPLGSADVILGIAWLETLGKIQFDYRTSVMDFRIGEWAIQLQGDRGLMKSQISLKSMMRTIGKGEQAVLIELNAMKSLVEVSEGGVTALEGCPSVIKDVVQLFPTVFASTVALPPKRALGRLTCDLIVIPSFRRMRSNVSCKRC